MYSHDMRHVFADRGLHPCRLYDLPAVARQE